MHDGGKLQSLYAAGIGAVLLAATLLPTSIGQTPSDEGSPNPSRRPTTEFPLSPGPNLNQPGTSASSTSRPGMTQPGGTGQSMQRPRGPVQNGDRPGGQRGFGRGQRQQPQAIDRSQYPQWAIDEHFRNDVFTFARIQYDGAGRTPDARWNNDFPDADLNFSWRLQQLTSMQVNPEGAVVRLEDPRLFEYPFSFMIGVTGIDFSDQEAATLREYLSSGGFLMVDDFWTPSEWRHIHREMKKVFPDLEPIELLADHPIFHIVYDLQEIPRVPSIRSWEQGQTFEYWHGDPEGDEAPHFMGYFDKRGRLMAVLCLNNDICDGWEREGENKEYFQLYSEKCSYPLGINIVFYALTH